MNVAQELDQGRKAFERGDWREAHDRLAVCVTAGATPDVLELLAIASYLTGRDDECTEAWTRAHLAWLDRGDYADAVRCAFWAGFGLMQRGETAQGGGWLARAGTLVQQHQLDGVERGYLLLPQALAAMGAGDLDAALEACGAASEVAHRFGDPDLAALGAIGRGEASVRSGLVPDGMRLYDEAMVAVTAGETSPIVSGIVYCAVIDLCQQIFDLRRAREWTDALERWCSRQPGLVPFQGQCLVHRAQILQAGGAWEEAMAQARRACERLAEPPHPAIGMAHYELGELHRLRGELSEAEAAYRRAHTAGRQPHPGLSLLRLDEGRIDAATAAIERALGDARDNVARTRLLPAFVEIMLAANRVDDARRGSDELAELAAETDSLLLAAMAAQALGAVLLAEGDARAAIEQLQAACRCWQELEAPYEAARTRALIAAACKEAGDGDTADLERDAARSVFEHLGARPALARLDRLSGQITERRDVAVTARELEVLRLVAAGRTNREIADALSISERTVERHLGNVFTKLDVPNRAAATAYAYDHGLV